ncbi:G2/mitotic-specific cyclin-B3 [Triplophysa tibetana]|uniref:G2/mitotic-specific cyclin-B3 n=1 Tax=Triplophysa tibetana TaxID=1572043 RepID=A0A5A9NRP7_9TELE|nr:G2/mitotic-specific cyclin-B3 [Triplophysa tibetana]
MKQVMPRPNSKINSSDIKYKEDVYNVKRTPSSPQGGPKKKTTKIQTGIQGNKSITVNKAPNRKVITKTRVTQKDCKDSSSEEQPKKAEFKAEGLPEDCFSVCQPDEQSTVQQQKVCVARVSEEFDIDKEHIGDCLMTPEYAKDIFDYLKNREVGFVA